MEEIYLSARELGEYINKPIRTIENWAAARNICQNPEGKYGLISAFKFQVTQLEGKLEKKTAQLEELSAVEDEDKSKLILRKLKAEVDKEEALARIKNLEADKLEGLLVSAEEVLQVWQSAIASAKAKFINIPAKLALELSGLDKPEDIQARLSSAIDEALTELGENVN